METKKEAENSVIPLYTEKRHISYIRAIFLPFVLCILFVLQNLGFNFWLGLFSYVFLLFLLCIVLIFGIKIA